ncbi:hypothetical protein LCGC14_2844360 [marine sediment metagenome]|uniref:Uncharacterized protein n=1 Tax=marine sediment metagenome TaxID=412755 RepID=A0A0F8YX02_9ZZZZ
MIQIKTNGTLWAWGSYDLRIEVKKRLYRAGMCETLMFLSPDYGLKIER